MSAGPGLVSCLCQDRSLASPRAARRAPAREAQVFRRGRASPWCLGGFPKPSTGPSDAIPTTNLLPTRTRALMRSSGGRHAVRKKSSYHLSTRVRRRTQLAQTLRAPRTPCVATRQLFRAKKTRFQEQRAQRDEISFDFALDSNCYPRARAHPPRLGNHSAAGPRHTQRASSQLTRGGACRRRGCA